MHYFINLKLTTATKCYFYYLFNFWKLNIPNSNYNNVNHNNYISAYDGRNDCRSDIKCDVDATVQFVETISVDNAKNYPIESLIFFTSRFCFEMNVSLFIRKYYFCFLLFIFIDIYSQQ